MPLLTVTSPCSLMVCVSLSMRLKMTPRHTAHACSDKLRSSLTLGGGDDHCNSSQLLAELGNQFLNQDIGLQKSAHACIAWA